MIQYIRLASIISMVIRVCVAHLTYAREYVVAGVGHDAGRRVACYRIGIIIGITDAKGFEYYF